MYTIFGGMGPAWIADADVATLTNWRTYAITFVLPRMLQRFAFNILANRVKQLRIDQASAGSTPGGGG
jgi:hypothetical protein